MLLLYSIYALPIAYLAELVVGIPAWIFFKRYDIRSLPAFAIAGALLGLLIYLAMTLDARTFVTPDAVAKPVDPWRSPYLFFCLVAGCSSAILFWIVAFSGRRRVQDSSQPQRKS